MSGVVVYVQDHSLSRVSRFYTDSDQQSSWHAIWSCSFVVVASMDRELMSNGHLKALEMGGRRGSYHAHQISQDHFLIGCVIFPAFFEKKKKNRWDLCMVYESSCTNHSKKSFHGFSSLAHASTPILVNCGRPIFRGGGGYMLREGDLVAIWGHCCLKAICCNLRTRLLVVDSIWTVSCNKHLWLSVRMTMAMHVPDYQSSFL